MVCFYAHSLCLLKEVSACGRRVWRKTKSWTLPVWGIQLRHRNICWVKGTSCWPYDAVVGQEIKRTVVSVVQTMKSFIKTDYCHPHWHLINTKDLNKIYLFQDDFLFILSIFNTDFSQIFVSLSWKRKSLTVCQKSDLWWKSFLSLINLFFPILSKETLFIFPIRKHFWNWFHFYFVTIDYPDFPFICSSD